MLLRDFSLLTVGSLRAHRMRSLLTALGIAVGVAAVVLLTSIGEGVQRFVLSEFTQFGTHVISITPGRTTTGGVPGGMFGTARPLTIADGEALRRLPGVRAVVSVVQGNAEVEFGRRSRRTTVLGVGSDSPDVWAFELAAGRFLPDDDPQAARAFAVLGAKMRRELFPGRSPLGERVRIGGSSFRVVGVMAEKGQVLGFDFDDTIFIPTSRALELFDREGVMEIDVRYDAGASDVQVSGAITGTLSARHGREDFTVQTQQEMLDVLGSVLGVLTLAVGALGGISLVVGAIGILTIMTIGVSERTAEIGLLRALGARRGQVLGLFLAEATVLSAAGGLAGLVVGVGGAQLLHLAIPALPVHTPVPYAVAALVMAALIGLLAGVLPARRAARLDPVEALRAE